MTTSPPSQPDIRSLLENGFDEETARSLYAQGEAVVVFVLMQLAELALKTHRGIAATKNAVLNKHL